MKDKEEMYFPVIFGMIFHQEIKFMRHYIQVKWNRGRHSPFWLAEVHATEQKYREAQKESRGKKFLKLKAPYYTEQKYYFQHYCLHICPPKEHDGHYILHILEQKVLNSYRKLLRKEMQPDHQLLPASPVLSRIQGSWFQATSPRGSQLPSTDWVAGCCFSRCRWERAHSAPHSAHSIISQKFCFK